MKFSISSLLRSQKVALNSTLRKSIENLNYSSWAQGYIEWTFRIEIQLPTQTMLISRSNSILINYLPNNLFNSNDDRDKFDRKQLRWSEDL